MRGRADAGEHQQLRRVEGARRHDHLAACLHLLAITRTGQVLDADRVRAAHKRARRMRTGLDREIAALARRPQISARG